MLSPALEQDRRTINKYSPEKSPDFLIYKRSELDTCLASTVSVDLLPLSGPLLLFVISIARESCYQVGIADIISNLCFTPDLEVAFSIGINNDSDCDDGPISALKINGQYFNPNNFFGESIRFLPFVEVDAVFVMVFYSEHSRLPSLKDLWPKSKPAD